MIDLHWMLANLQVDSLIFIVCKRGNLQRLATLSHATRKLLRAMPALAAAMASRSIPTAFDCLAFYGADLLAPAIHTIGMLREKSEIEQLVRRPGAFLLLFRMSSWVFPYSGVQLKLKIVISHISLLYARAIPHSDRPKICAAVLERGSPHDLHILFEIVLQRGAQPSPEWPAIVAFARRHLSCMGAGRILSAYATMPTAQACFAELGDLADQAAAHIVHTIDAFSNTQHQSLEGLLTAALGFPLPEDILAYSDDFTKMVRMGQPTRHICIRKMFLVAVYYRLRRACRGATSSLDFLVALEHLRTAGRQPLIFIALAEAFTATCPTGAILQRLILMARDFVRSIPQGSVVFLSHIEYILELAESSPLLGFAAAAALDHLLHQYPRLLVPASSSTFRSLARAARAHRGNPTVSHKIARIIMANRARLPMPARLRRALGAHLTAVGARELVCQWAALRC